MAGRRQELSDGITRDTVPKCWSFSTRLSWSPHGGRDLGPPSSSFACFVPVDSIAVSVPLVVEYESALLRNMSPGQRPSHVTAFVDYLCRVAHKQDVFFLWRPVLNDPNDDMVVESAMASRASAIITHNLRDFVPAAGLGVRVLAPAQFLLHLQGR